MPILVAGCLCGGRAAAQEDAGPCVRQDGKQIEDCAASPQPEGLSPKVTIGDWFSPRYRGVDNTQGNSVVVRGYFPWSLGGVDQLTRISTPITTAAPGKGAADGNLIDDFPSGPTGLGDIELYDIVQFKTGWGQISFGPVFSLPTGTHSGVGNGRLTLGPAGGFNMRSGRLTLGVFSQSDFSIAGTSAFSSISKSKIQPIVDWSLPDGWSVGTSDMNFSYDWKKSRFTYIPVGASVGKAFETESRKMKLSAQAEYNVLNTTGASAWTCRFTWEFALPELY